MIIHEQEISIPNCPICLGTPLRTPVSAWCNWGIRWKSDSEFHRLVEKSERAYESEWKNTREQTLQDIASAAQLAGLGDANQRLNDAIAQTVLELVGDIPGPLHIVDLGAGSGATATTIVKAISSLAGRATFHLVDPASCSLKDAEKNMKVTGLEVGSSLRLHKARDLELVSLLPAHSIDLIVANASIHHHAYLDPVIRALLILLKPGGWLVIGDWHCTLWMHPGRVWNLIESLVPGEETQALQVYKNYFGDISSPPEEDTELDQANYQIAEFWRCYAKVKTPTEPPFIVLEGHRSLDEYREILNRCGFKCEKKQKRLIKGSALLAVTVAQKPK